MMDKPDTPPETLTRAWPVTLQNGVRYAYTFNIIYKETGGTFRHQYGLRLDGRVWYELSDWKYTEEGCCTCCGAAYDGVFDGKPGDRGRKRQPIWPKAFANALPSAVH